MPRPSLAEVRQLTPRSDACVELDEAYVLSCALLIKRFPAAFGRISFCRCCLDELVACDVSLMAVSLETTSQALAVPSRFVEVVSGLTDTLHSSRKAVESLASKVVQAMVPCFAAL